MKEKNKILAEFAGFKITENSVTKPNGEYRSQLYEGQDLSYYVPDFYNPDTGLSDLFKYVASKLREHFMYVELQDSGSRYFAGVRKFNKDKPISDENHDFFNPFEYIVGHEGDNPTECLASACVKAVESIGVIGD